MSYCRGGAFAMLCSGPKVLIPRPQCQGDKCRVHVCCPSDHPCPCVSTLPYWSSRLTEVAVKAAELSLQPAARSIDGIRHAGSP
eukprot:4218146-Amphidinium_carterae.1